MADVHVDRLALIEHRVSEFAEHMREVRGSMATLVALNERQTHILDKMAAVANRVEDHELRLRDVEKYQPALRETRTWIISGMSIVGAAIITFALNAVVLPPPSQRHIAVQPPIYSPPPEARQLLPR